MPNDTPTSSGVCTPRYMRENAVSTITAAQATRSHVRFVQRPRQPKEAKTFCVCPLGNE